MAFRTLNKSVALEPLQNGTVRSYVAEETILQGQFVREGGTDAAEVEPSATDGEHCVGIALYDASAGGTVVVAQDNLRVRATSGTGSVAAYERVASHGSTGEEGEVATAASGDWVLGRAVKDDLGDGDDVEMIVETPYIVDRSDPNA